MRTFVSLCTAVMALGYLMQEYNLYRIVNENDYRFYEVTRYCYWAGLVAALAVTGVCLTAWAHWLQQRLRTKAGR